MYNKKYSFHDFIDAINAVINHKLTPAYIKDACYNTLNELFDAAHPDTCDKAAQIVREHAKNLCYLTSYTHNATIVASYKVFRYISQSYRVEVEVNND